MREEAQVITRIIAAIACGGARLEAGYNQLARCHLCVREDAAVGVRIIAAVADAGARLGAMQRATTGSTGARSSGQRESVRAIVKRVIEKSKKHIILYNIG